MALSTSDEAYRQAGVDLKSADAVVEIAKEAARHTRMPWLLGGIGGFSGAFELPEGYRNPVLLCACDGVGTKLKLAFEAECHTTVGIDLVAMSVNDILVNGGKPLVFLDYLATDKIRPPQLAQILAGITEGCKQAGCALIGGETAEMPGFYANQEYDLAGFCVGVAEKERLYPRLNQIQPGDALIGLNSSGLHSNGYSLVRKILSDNDLLSPEALKVHMPELGGTLDDILLTPTRIYVASVLKLLEALPDAVKGMIHVTGGGFYDNIPRILPSGISAELDSKSWQAPNVFQYLQTLGKLSPETMWHTFNAGIGFILVVDTQQASAVLDFLAKETPEQASVIGHLASQADPNAPRVIIR